MIHCLRCGVPLLHDGCPLPDAPLAVFRVKDGTDPEWLSTVGGYLCGECAKIPTPVRYRNLKRGFVVDFPPFVVEHSAATSPRIYPQNIVLKGKSL